MNDEKYAEVLRRREKAGAGDFTIPVPARGKLCSDVFDTQANFEDFGKTLLPIVGELRIDVGAPVVTPVHNITRG